MSINWFALGVSAEQQRQPPGIRSFPVAFNPNAKRYWEEAVGTISETNPRRAWSKVFDLYIDLCGSASVYPFVNKSSNNDRIYKILIDARRRVVTFIENNNLNTDVIVRKTERRVTVTNTGFVLRCIGSCDVLPEAPQVVSSMGNRTTRHGLPYGSVWSVGLDKGLTFFVANEYVNMSGRWHYGYELEVSAFPYLPGIGAPSSSQIEKFVLEVLYLPILRAYRPIGLQHRLV